MAGFSARESVGIQETDVPLNFTGRIPGFLPSLPLLVLSVVHLKLPADLVGGGGGVPT